MVRPVFESEVEGWVLSALASTKTWSELLRALPGVYPSEALAAVQRLATLKETVADVRIRSIRAISQAETAPPAGPPPQPWREGQRPLAVPHPLDFEWRFTPASADLLLDRCNPSGRSIALIGAPTLFIRAAERGASDRFTLLDRNSKTISRLLGVFPRSQVYVHDACADTPPAGAFDAAVLDPPWYAPHVRGFLWTASLAVREGGTVMLSLPPPGARPEVGAERRALFAWANKCLSLDLTDIEAGCIRYLSPPFEWNALRAAGIGGVPPDWRCGDLATFRVVRRLGSVPAERPSPPSQIVRWAEFEALGVRIRFRPVLPAASGPPTLYPIVEGGILPSVSARDDRRKRATVWTSGNRAFVSSNPLRLRSDLVSLVRNGTLSPSIAPRTGALGQLAAVIFQEQNEYAVVGSESHG